VAQNRNIANVIQEATQINKFTYNAMFFFQILPYNVTQDFSPDLLLCNRAEIFFRKNKQLLIGHI
jgi:hypothetical protein